MVETLSSAMQKIANNAMVRLTVVGGMGLALMIPLMMIGGLVNERKAYRQQARQSVAQSWTDSQTVVGPILTIPYQSRIQPRDDEKSEEKSLFVMPDEMNVEAALDSETRRRGIHGVPVYRSQVAIEGQFVIDPDTLPVGVTMDELDLDGAHLIVAVSDNRGFIADPRLRWGDTPLRMQSGFSFEAIVPGLHAMLPEAPDVKEPIAFTLEFDLRGMEDFEIAPIGRQTNARVTADWPHPKFAGSFLPVQHEITADRFSANWSVSGLASGAGEARLSAGPILLSRLIKESFGVTLIEPVDLYRQSERSVKYGALIIVLTFTTFCLIEITGRRRLHPVQYLLVGLALLVFFVLLLALAEHIGFLRAYIAAAAACVGLVAMYSVSAFQSMRDGAKSTASLGGLYAMLYAILASEANALLMGSLLLFTALAAVMLVTRNIRWYTDSQSTTIAAKNAPL